MHTPDRHGERGASAVEYALLLAGIAGILVLAIVALGGVTNGLFDNSCDTIGQEIHAATC